MFELPQKTATYGGTERRHGIQRRKGANRREEFRFQPGMADRRQGRARRKSGGWDDRLSH